MERLDQRIYLSPPCMSGTELDYVREVFDQNWIAPVGPHLTRFEETFTKELGGGHAVALASGTSAIHLALVIAGVQPGDEVICPSMTFVASCNPIRYVGAEPVFIDCDSESWQIAPNELAGFLRRRRDVNRLPRYLLPVHLYGHPVDLDSLNDLCREFGLTMIEDAAEALGCRYKGRPVGLDGFAGAYSFNGNKIITTSGGGMLVSRDAEVVERARFLSTQARDPAPHYEHSELGYNFRLSNVLAAIGLGQMEALSGFVERTRANFAFYSRAFEDVEAIQMMPVPEWADPTHWLSCFTLDPRKTSATPEALRLHLEELNIESRPLWKPMHLQPLYSACETIGGQIAEGLFRCGLCLPSGPSLTERDLSVVSQAVKQFVLSPH